MKGENREFRMRARARPERPCFRQGTNLVQIAKRSAAGSGRVGSDCRGFKHEIPVFALRAKMTVFEGIGKLAAKFNLLQQREIELMMLHLDISRQVLVLKKRILKRLEKN